MGQTWIFINLSIGIRGGFTCIIDALIYTAADPRV